MTGAEELVEVRLIGLPLPVHALAQEQGEALRREFTLIAQQLDGAGEAGRAGVPTRLLELTAALRDRYAGFTVEQEDAIDAALEAGAPSLDLTFTVPASAADGVQALDAILDDADAYCREGTYLLTLASPPLLVTYRRWYLSEFARQIAGHPPTLWPEYLARHL